VTCTIDERGVVRASMACTLRAPRTRVWGWMRDWRSFLEMDPLHVRVEALDPPLPHADLRIRHRLLGVGVDRVGRILRWREGKGFIVSDLSRRSPGVGFPHVCEFALQDAGPGATRVLVGVRGRWTARFVPRPVVRAWITLVLAATVGIIRLHWVARPALPGR